jgi:hypothetical protein
LYAFKHFFVIDVQNQSPTVTLQEHLFCRVHRRPSGSRLWFTQLLSRAVVPILMQTVTIRVDTVQSGWAVEFFTAVKLK